MSDTEQIVPALPMAVRLLNDWELFGWNGDGAFSLTLKAGEVGEYFPSINYFTFKRRCGIMPAVFANDIMANPDRWEPLPKE